MPNTFKRVLFEKFAQQFCCQISYRSYLLQINSNTFPPTQPNGFCHKATLAKASGTNQYKMIGAIKKLANIAYFLTPVSKKLCLDDCTEFKRIFHVTTFSVTTFFVVGAKIMNIPQTAKLFLDYYIPSNSSHIAEYYIPLSAQSPRSRLR